MPETTDTGNKSRELNPATIINNTANHGTTNFVLVWVMLLLNLAKNRPKTNNIGAISMTRVIFTMTAVSLAALSIAPAAATT